MMREPTEAEQTAIDAWWDENDPDRDNYDCTDNFRIATVGNAEEQAKYARAENNGCCGYCDVTLTTADGVEFNYGFNYGH